ncbi:MAG: hypothetical protein WD069_20310 [Planctomycetales bacterium]
MRPKSNDNPCLLEVPPWLALRAGVRWTGAALIAVLMAAGIASAADAPPPAAKPSKLPFTVSKETTHITEPLRADGSPDFAAALDERAKQGVTPENIRTPDSAKE